MPLPSSPHWTPTITMAGMSAPHDVPRDGRRTRLSIRTGASILGPIGRRSGGSWSYPVVRIDRRAGRHRRRRSHSSSAPFALALVTHDALRVRLPTMVANFFSFFTIQSNLATAVTLDAWAPSGAIRHRHDRLRGAAVVRDPARRASRPYMIVTRGRRTTSCVARHRAGAGRGRRLVERDPPRVDPRVHARGRTDGYRSARGRLGRPPGSWGSTPSCGRSTRSRAPRSSRTPAPGSRTVSVSVPRPERRRGPDTSA